MSPLGTHVMLDAWWPLAGFPGPAALLEACEASIAASGMTVECAVRKDFRPQGVTAVWVLSESHFTLHTYPEEGYISVDCYTCGDRGDPGGGPAAAGVRGAPARPGSAVTGEEGGFAGFDQLFGVFLDAAAEGRVRGGQLGVEDGGAVLAEAREFRRQADRPGPVAARHMCSQDTEFGFHVAAPIFTV